MVSPTLAQLLERTRVRFGVEVEVLDSQLKIVYPDSGSDLSRSIEESASVRQVLLEAMAGGRPHRLETGGQLYGIYPLSRSIRRRHAGGLLAIRRSSHGPSSGAEVETWSDLARAIVEADVAAVESVAEERHRSQRLTGALRFLEHVIGSANERALAQALVHAAAVWYDVDARVYQRTASGGFRLHTSLPAAPLDEADEMLGDSVLGNGLDLVRMDSGTELGRLGTANEAVLVPLVVAGPVEWLLVLIGTVPVDAEPVLRLIGRTAGAQLGTLAARATAEVRDRVAAALGEATRAPELLAMRVLHILAHSVGASGASLSLRRNGQQRRIATIGSLGSEFTARPLDAGFEADRVADPLERTTRTLQLGSAGQATLELASSDPLNAGAIAIIDACASVLRSWLAGSLSSFEGAVVLPYAVDGDAYGFSARIQEELERARRFDLRLSLILVDFVAPTGALAQLQDAVRSELRGSDVTGKMSGSQVAALLTHTDAEGLENVVRRLRQRLADTAEQLNVSDLKLGQAAFSPDYGRQMPSSIWRCSVPNR